MIILYACKEWLGKQNMAINNLKGGLYYIQILQALEGCNCWTFSTKKAIGLRGYFVNTLWEPRWNIIATFCGEANQFWNSLFSFKQIWISALIRGRPKNVFSVGSSLTEWVVRRKWCKRPDRQRERGRESQGQWHQTDLTLVLSHYALFNIISSSILFISSQDW